MSVAAYQWNATLDAALRADNNVVDAVTTGSVVGIFSGLVPPNVRLDDYIDLGSDDSTAFGRFGGNGENLRTVIHIWCRITNRSDGVQVWGKAPVLEIASYIAGALNDRNLTIAAYGTAWDIKTVLETVFPDPDGEYMHGVMRVTAIARPG